jgi:hypothetical protein
MNQWQSNGKSEWLPAFKKSPALCTYVLVEVASAVRSYCTTLRSLHSNQGHYAKMSFTLGFSMLNFSISGCPSEAAWDTPQKCSFTLGFWMLKISTWVWSWPSSHSSSRASWSCQPIVKWNNSTTTYHDIVQSGSSPRLNCTHISVPGFRILLKRNLSESRKNPDCYPLREKCGNCSPGKKNWARKIPFEVDFWKDFEPFIPTSPAKHGYWNNVENCLPCRHFFPPRTRLKM